MLHFGQPRNRNAISFIWDGIFSFELQFISLDLIESSESEFNDFFVEAVLKGSLDTFHYSRTFYFFWSSSLPAASRFFLTESEKLSRKHYL
jgi:hypothetical protein